MVVSMKKIVSCLILFSISTFAATSEENNAIKLVKKYSSTVACSINTQSYKAIKSTIDYEDYYVVYWEGDLGCSMGRGSINGQFTVVRNTRFGDQYVLPQVQQPEIDLVCVDSMIVNNEEVAIYGVSYGENDHQSAPNKKIQYNVKLEPYKDRFTLLEKVEEPNQSVSNKCTSRVR